MKQSKRRRFWQIESPLLYTHFGSFNKDGWFHWTTWFSASWWAVPSADEGVSGLMTSRSRIRGSQSQEVALADPVFREKGRLGGAAQHLLPATPCTDRTKGQLAAKESSAGTRPGLGKIEGKVMAAKPCKELGADGPLAIVWKPLCCSDRGRLDRT